MTKPEPLTDVYDWLALRAYLAEQAAEVLKELEALMALPGWLTLGKVRHIQLRDYDTGAEQGLSPASVEWLKQNVAPAFWVWAWY
jgi:hypothetical protein